MATRSVVSRIWCWFLVLAVSIELLTANESTLAVFFIIVAAVVIAWSFAYVVRVIRLKGRTIHLGRNM